MTEKHIHKWKIIGWYQPETVWLFCWGCYKIRLEPRKDCTQKDNGEIEVHSDKK